MQSLKTLSSEVYSCISFVTPGSLLSKRYFSPLLTSFLHNYVHVISIKYEDKITPIRHITIFRLTAIISLREEFFSCV